MSRAFRLFVICSLSSLASGAFAHESCPARGDFSKDPATYAEEAARNMIVSVQGVFAGIPITGAGTVVGYQPELSVVVDPQGTVQIQDDPCSYRVLVLTAFHLVNDNGRQADSISIKLPGAEDPPIHAEVIRQAPSLDVAILGAKLRHGFVWTGFRPALTLRPGEAVRAGVLQNDAPQFLPTAYQHPNVNGDVQLLLAGTNIKRGDSGGPVFDRDWNIVGMIVNEGDRADQGLVLPSEEIQFILLNIASANSFPTVVQMRGIRAREREEADWNGTDTYTMAGVGRQYGTLGAPDATWPNMAYFGMGGDIPFWHERFFGTSFIANWWLKGGYPRSSVFFEAGADIGFSLFFFRNRNVRVAAAWSPSLVPWMGDYHTGVVLEGYTISAELGTADIKLGADFRPAAFVGDKPNFVEADVWLRWRHVRD